MWWNLATDDIAWWQVIFNKNNDCAKNMHAFFYFTTISPRKRAKHIEFRFNTQESFVAMGWYWNIGSGKHEKLNRRRINCHL